MENVCKFIPMHTIPDTVQTVNFVVEKTDVERVEKISSLYRVNYVVSGTGTVTLNGVEKSVTAGDVFFVFPATSYKISGSVDFVYSYISFLGLRANLLIERLGITKQNFCYENFSELDLVWQNAVNISSDFSDLASESVLLYTLAVLGDKNKKGEKESVTGEKFLYVKKYVDDNFSDAELNLSKIAKEFCYNKSYLSTSFKKEYKIGLVEYLTLVRINHACALMDSGYRGISDIANLCGFRDSMYFSKVFKERIGYAPREYIQKRSLVVDNEK